MLTAATPLPLAAEDVLFGRRQQMDLLRRLLEPQARNRVIVLHGEVGVGKSALAAAAATAWRAAGGVVEPVRTGAQTEPTGPRRLLVAEPDVAPPAAAWDGLLRSLRPEDRLIVAVRVPVALPIDDSRLIEIAVVALSWDDSVELLARDGVDPEARPALVRWAQGVPLRLVLGAQAQVQHPDWQPGEGVEPASLTERLARRLDTRRVPTVSQGGPSFVDGALRHELREAAEQAVRHFQSPERLAENPLGRGATATGRVEHLRGVVEAALEQTFGTCRNDRALCEVVTAGYLVAAIPHEAMACELFLSRSTYFRRLATGLGRVADRIADGVLEEHAAAPLALAA